MSQEPDTSNQNSSMLLNHMPQSDTLAPAEVEQDEDAELFDDVDYDDGVEDGEQVENEDNTNDNNNNVNSNGESDNTEQVVGPEQRYSVQRSESAISLLNQLPKLENSNARKAKKVN